MKKVLAGILVFTALVMVPFNSYAASADAPDSFPPPAQSSYRYDAILVFEGQLDISGTSVSATVSARLHSDYDSNTKIVLDKSTDGSKWSRVSTLADKDSSSSSYRTTGSKSGLDPAYDYRITAYLTVYDSKGNVIDSDYKEWYFNV